MISVSFYYDQRKPKASGLYTVRCMIASGGRRIAAMPVMELSPEHWADSQKPKPSTSMGRQCRQACDALRVEITEIEYAVNARGERCTLEAVKAALELARNPGDAKRRNSLGAWIEKRIALKEGKTRTSLLCTKTRVEAFGGMGDSLDEVTPGWLQRFDSFLSHTNPSPNARAVHMRNLRAVINYAIDEGATENYPFRRFRIRTQPTLKRALSVAQLRQLWNATGTFWEERSRDLFFLSFFLRGVNITDLLTLTQANVDGDRLKFRRAKTGQPYSIKIEPEAAAILEKYKGEKMLLKLCEEIPVTEFALHQLNKYIKRIGNTTLGRYNKKITQPLFPGISTYWARHSWATAAAALDVPKEIIAHGLGHAQRSVTDVYIAFDETKCDEANRRVIDWVIYGKR